MIVVELDLLSVDEAEVEGVELLERLVVVDTEVLGVVVLDLLSLLENE